MRERLWESDASQYSTTTGQQHHMTPLGGMVTADSARSDLGRLSRWWSSHHLLKAAPPGTAKGVYSGDCDECLSDCGSLYLHVPRARGFRHIRECAGVHARHLPPIIPASAGNLRNPSTEYCVLQP